MSDRTGTAKSDMRGGRADAAEVKDCKIAVANLRFASSLFSDVNSVPLICELQSCSRVHPLMA